VQLAISEFTEKHSRFLFGMGTRYSGQVYLPIEIQEMLKESGPPAMRDLRIYGKNRLLGLFRAWLEKQIGVKARAGRENLSEL